MLARALIACSCALSMSQVAAETCPNAVPEGLKVTPVADQVAVHGMTMAVSQVQGKVSAKAVLERTHERWKREGRQVKRNSAAGWDILATMGKGCLVTLQLIERNGAFGYFARSKAGKPTQLTAASFGVHLPPGAKVDSSVTSEDDGRKSLVLSMSSQRSLDELNAFFMQQLAAADWRATRSHKVRAQSGREVLLVSAQKKRERVEIMIWPERASQIVMTISEAI